MLAKSNSLSPTTKDSYYFMFFPKQIRLTSSETQKESKLKFAIWKGTTAFSSSKNPIQINVTKEFTKLPRIELPFYLREFNINRTVEYNIQLYDISQPKQIKIGEIVENSEKYVKAYINGKSQLQQTQQFGQFQVNFVILIERDRHSLQKLTTNYKIQNGYIQRSNESGSKSKFGSGLRPYSVQQSIGHVSEFRQSNNGDELNRNSSVNANQQIFTELKTINQPKSTQNSPQISHQNKWSSSKTEKNYKEQKNYDEIVYLKKNVKGTKSYSEMNKDYFEPAEAKQLQQIQDIIAEKKQQNNKQSFQQIDKNYEKQFQEEKQKEERQKQKQPIKPIKEFKEQFRNNRQQQNKIKSNNKIKQEQDTNAPSQQKIKQIAPRSQQKVQEKIINQIKQQENSCIKWLFRFLVIVLFVTLGFYHVNNPINPEQRPAAKPRPKINKERHFNPKI